MSRLPCSLRVVLQCAGQGSLLGCAQLGTRGGIGFGWGRRECASAQTCTRLGHGQGEQSPRVVIRTGRSFALAEAVLINLS